MMQLKTTYFRIPYTLVCSNDKLHIERVCKAHKGGEKILLPLQLQHCGTIERPVAHVMATPLVAVGSVFYFGAY